MTSSLFSPASVAAVVLASLIVSSAASPSISTPTSLRGNIVIDIPAFAVKDGYACKSTRTTRRRRHPPHLFIPLLSSGGRRPSLPSLSSLAADDIHDDSGIGRDVNHTPAESERRRLFLAAALLLDGAVFGLSTDAASAEEVGYLNVNDKIRSEAASAAYPTTVCVGSEEERRIAIFEKVAPSVVFIDTFTERKDAFSTNVMEVPIGSGSGFVWDDAGHIVTNFHVVQQAKFAQVAILTSSTVPVNVPLLDGSTTASLSPVSTAILNPLSSVRPGAIGSSESTVLTNFRRYVYKAKVVGVDPAKDVAVLKIDLGSASSDLRPVELGTSTGLRVGQSALAIGNPFGLDHTLTSGVISGIGREVKSPIGRPISNVIQTDAAINPGNSGGPLLDSSGKLIGMATAIYSPSGASAGVGFAIPIDTVRDIAQMLIENGQIVRPLLGVSILDSKQARQALGINKGVLILEVKPGTPAANAGLRGIRRSVSGIIEIGDIIVAIEGYGIEKEGDLFQAVERFKPGDVVNVKVNRPDVESGLDGIPEIRLRELTFAITLISSDPSTFLQK